MSLLTLFDLDLVLLLERDRDLDDFPSTDSSSILERRLLADLERDLIDLDDDFDRFDDLERADRSDLPGRPGTFL